MQTKKRWDDIHDAAGGHSVNSARHLGNVDFQMKFLISALLHITPSIHYEIQVQKEIKTRTTCQRSPRLRVHRYVHQKPITCITSPRGHVVAAMGSNKPLARRRAD
jgi:hypothetical protein